MVYIASADIGLPKYEYDQKELKLLSKEVFSQNPRHHRKVKRYLSVFDHAAVEKRQIVKDKEWYRHSHSFSERNAIYEKKAVELSVKAIDRCLQHANINKSITYSDIDLLIFVSSTGIATPSIDAHIINKRPFKQNIVRMPLWGLGCGGGASGLARAAEWLKYNTTKCALVVCCELCSLTFQQKDGSASNIVGTALFGDGVAAALLVGEQFKNVEQINRKLLILKTDSYIEQNTLHIMGWDITDNGFEVIFSKRIPKLIRTLWKSHFNTFIKANELNIQEISAFLAHPGGRKVLEEMEKILQSAKGLEQNLFHYSYEVLKNHGNMSSATVLYVLRNYLNNADHKNTSTYMILSALGPGFFSKLLLLRWA